MTVYGWDASDYDWSRGPMDLASAKAVGVQFFTHKVTEGTSVVHKHCGEALTRARDAGIEFLGAYVVVRTGPVGPQVDHALAELDRQVPWWRTFPGFFLQVDLEKWNYDAVAAAQGVEMARQLRDRTGRWVVLYAPRWAYGDDIAGTDPLWASDYGSNPASPMQQVYPGDTSPRWRAYSGRTPVFLQYGSRLTIGRQPTADGNAFRGTIEQLRAIVSKGGHMSLGDRTLKVGDQGEDVFVLRVDLHRLGFLSEVGSGAASGTFDAALRDGVTAYQRAKGFTADGVVTAASVKGAKTAAGILADIAALDAQTPPPAAPAEPAPPPVSDVDAAALRAELAAVRALVEQLPAATAAALASSFTVKGSLTLSGSAVLTDVTSEFEPSTTTS